MTLERDERVKTFVQFVNDRLREATHQPKEQTKMADLEKTLLVHLAKAAAYLEGTATDDNDKARNEIFAAIDLLTAEKPKRTRKSKNG